jgi:hypothetical protein
MILAAARRRIRIPRRCQSARSAFCASSHSNVPPAPKPRAKDVKYLLKFGARNKNTGCGSGMWIQNAAALCAGVSEYAWRESNGVSSAKLARSING